MNLEYDQFIRSSNKPWCWACGRDERQRPDGWFGPWYLQRAHVGSGSGSCLRKEDARCVIILCPRCHALHGRARILGGDGDQLEYLENAHTLWLKKKRDPERWDPPYLEQLWVGQIPRPSEPPGWFTDQYLARREPAWKRN